MARGRARFLSVLAMGSCAFGCAAPAPPVPAPTAPPAALRPTELNQPSSGRALLDADWGFLEASDCGVALMVPERAAWQPQPGGRWCVARHAASGALLQVRTWSARRTVSRAECEKELFVSQRELRAGADGELLEERAGTAPRGYDVWLRLWLDQAGEGIALATGAGPGECYAAVFRARGDEMKLGGELRLAADGMLSHVELLGVEAVRAPERPPAF
jgi:hypothetical protein